MLCFFYFCVLNKVRWLILVACVNYTNVMVNSRGAHYVIVILYLLGLGHLTCLFL